jgi:hypothetical protein
MFGGATDTAADAAQIILRMALRSCDGVPDVLVVDHDPKSIIRPQRWEAN